MEAKKFYDTSMKSGRTRTIVPDPTFNANQDREKGVFQSLTQTHCRIALSIIIGGTYTYGGTG